MINQSIQCSSYHVECILMVVSSIPYTILVNRITSALITHKICSMLTTGCNRVLHTRTLYDFPGKAMCTKACNYEERYARFAHTNMQLLCSSSNGTSSSPCKSEVEGEVVDSIPTRCKSKLPIENIPICMCNSLTVKLINRNFRI
jgi:hypothetical protein